MKHPEKSHKPADAMDWDEAMRVVRSLYRDGSYRESLLVAAGCNLGLRVSDLLSLTWGQLCGEDRKFSIVEKKTRKSRVLKVNDGLHEHSMACRKAMGDPSDGEPAFRSGRYSHAQPITRQQVANLLKDIKKKYRIRSAVTFSSHSLRKTFGRRVWQTECERGRGEQALVLLCDVFGHSNVSITKRYLGIRQDEILSVYDSIGGIF